MSIANELITRGWSQGRYEAKDGSVCIRRAARYAYGNQLSERVERALAIACGEPSECPCVPGLVFNDAKGRTFDEVLRVAKEADEILDAS